MDVHFGVNGSKGEISCISCLWLQFSAFIPLFSQNPEIPRLRFHDIHRKIKFIAKYFSLFIAGELI
jgi:hypothetical protein